MEGVGAEEGCENLRALQLDYQGMWRPMPVLTHLKRRSPSRPLVASSSGNSSRGVGGSLVEAQNLLSDSTNSPRPSISMKPRDQHTKLGGLLSRGWEQGRERARGMLSSDKTDKWGRGGDRNGVRGTAPYLVVSKAKPGGQRAATSRAPGTARTHGATAGEQVDYVVIEGCHVVGNEDPDAWIPEPRVLLPGHEPQHRTHGPHHEPADAGAP